MLQELSLFQLRELTETLWNVNQHIFRIRDRYHYELIETLRNVNLFMN